MVAKSQPELLSTARWCASAKVLFSIFLVGLIFTDELHKTPRDAAFAHAHENSPNFLGSVKFDGFFLIP
jgi:hypothetical protein